MKSEPAGDIRASWNNKNTASFGCYLVNQILNLLCVYGTIGEDTVVGQFVLFAQGLHVDGCQIVEPLPDRSAIRPKIDLCLDFRLCQKSKRQQNRC